MYDLMVRAAGIAIAGLAVLIAAGCALLVEWHRERTADREHEREWDLFRDPNPRAFLELERLDREAPGRQQDAAAWSLVDSETLRLRGHRFLGSGPNLPGSPS